MKYLLLLSAFFVSACKDEKPTAPQKPEQNILNQNTDHAHKRVGEMNEKISENHDAVLKAGE